jgi:hypothetical protein
MKLLLVLVCLAATCTSISGQRVMSVTVESIYTRQSIEVKKKINGKPCDSCVVPYAFNGDPDFSYVLAGAGYTPSRLYVTSDSIRKYIRAGISHVHFTPKASFSIFLLPNFLTENGKRHHIYRNFDGLDYQFYEYQAVKNNTVLNNWTHLSNIKNNSTYDILLKNKTADTVEKAMVWPGALFTGNYNLKVNDSLKIFIRNIKTKKIERGIYVQRVREVPNKFTFLQLPKLDEKNNSSLQNFLNADIKSEETLDGERSVNFSKDADKTGILYFRTEKDDVLEYSYDDTLHWQSARAGNFVSNGSGISIVVDKDVLPGQTRDLYLRYQHQPETIHKIVIHARSNPEVIPWAKIAIISTLLLLMAGAWFYLYNRRQKQKLVTLAIKNTDIETRLSLLSGQLNPHFLFNSLHAIQGTINSNNINEANEYISSVANFMRTIMDYGKKEFISLKEELGLEADYLKLEQKRNHFSFNTHIEPGIDTALVDFPPLLLQPVLENSLRHAFVISTTKPILEIFITASQKDLIISIKDNGVGWNTATNPEGHGLGLVRKRIELLNEKIADMPISTVIVAAPNEGTSTIFTFKNWLA